MMIDIIAPLTEDELRSAFNVIKNDNARPIMPIPDGVTFSNKDIDYHNKQFGCKPTKAYRYHNESGQMLGFIVRWDFIKDKEPGKTFRPFLYCELENGSRKWMARGFPEPRPLYNLHEIGANPSKPIMVFEGEKAADVGKTLFSDYVHTTAMHGSESPNKTDWSPVKDRTVVICPDNDVAGTGYSDAVYNLCKQVGAKSIKQYNMQVFAQYAIVSGNIIERARTLPAKYDFVDALEENWTADLLKKLDRMQQQMGLLLTIDYPEPVSDALFNDEDEDWPDPLPIKAELLPVEPFNILLLPEPLQAWVADIAHRMQCPIDQIAVPAIVIISSLIGARCGIRPKRNDNWLVIPNLWGGIVGKPSTLKSPSLAEIMKPLNNMEANARAKYEDQLNNYIVESEFNKLAQAALKKQMEKELAKPKGEITEEQKQTYKNFEQIEKPVCKRHKTNDASVEKMGELLSENPRGLLLFRDELIGLLASWDKSGQESDRAFYLESWNGYGSHTSDRIGRGTTHCDNMCVSILGSTQPTKLSGYLHKAIRNIENDGLMQRFQLLIYPDDIKDWQHIDVIPNKSEKERVFNLVERIAELDFSLFGASLEEDNAIPYFHFSKDAQVLFDAWLTDLELIKLRRDEEDIIVEHLAKYRKLMPALALIFHILDLVDGKASGQVTVQSAERAAAWCDYLESHARRIYGMVLDKTYATSALSKKIKKRSLKNGFTVREVYRKGWSMLTTTEDVQDACDELVDAGWLREQYIESLFGKGKIVYLINPSIWGNHE